MIQSDNDRFEETLDPADWGEMRALAHRMVDDMMDTLQGVREEEVWQPVPEEVHDFLDQPAPHQPQDALSVYQDFRQYVLPYRLGNIHPRFWGWVIGTGSPMGMLADMLAAGMNPNLGGGNHGANFVEGQVIRWCKEVMGFPGEASGLLVSGGSMANLVGLTVARNTMADFALRRDGLSAAPRKMICYASKQTHDSCQKAIELLGLGSENLRLIAVNDQFEIEPGALEEAIAADRAAGHQPFCIIGNAGTVNTGAFDDLDALAEICWREKMWFHVDGAFGALAALAPNARHLVAGMDRANSLAFDMHKWMYMPIEIGCVLVRNEEDHYRAFTLTPDYLAHTERGPASGQRWFSDYGIQLSRGFRALKAWMMIKEAGLEKYGRLIQQNIDQATYLANLVDRAPELELMAPVPLNIVCFRYRVDGMGVEMLNSFNEELLIRLQESGVALPSYSRINGSYVLRAAIVNHRSRREDFEIMIEKVLQLGREMLMEENWTARDQASSF